MTRSIYAGSRATALAALAIAGVAFACGPREGRQFDATLEVPQERDARVTVTPALDVSELFDASIADRIRIDEITINLTDARLLGADPRIPTGGLMLLAAPRLVSAYGVEDTGVALPFPEFLLDQDDLAVYVRLDQSAALDGASVVIRARVYSKPANGGSSSLTSTDPESPDPDGDPADDPEDDVSRKDRPIVDPDGDPARDPPCSPDPDGDPAVPCPEKRKRALVTRGEDQRSVAIELRGNDVADLVASLNADSTLDVVIGIPAAKWFTPQAMRALDRQLAGESEMHEDRSENRSDRDGIMVLTRKTDQQSAARQEMSEDGEDYFISDDPNLGGLKVRRE